jgi:AraC-like DNA-binding protein
MARKSLKYRVDSSCFGGAVLEYHYVESGWKPGIERHAHETYQFCWSANNSGRYECAGHTHEHPAGTLSMIEPCTAHAVPSDDTRDFAGTWQVAYIPHDMLLGLSISNAILDGPAASAFNQFFELAMSQPRTDSIERLETKDAFDDFADLLKGKQRGETPELHKRSQPTAELRKARDLLMDLKHPNLSLAALAKECGMGVDELRRAFVRQFGVPPHRFQLLRRLEHARHLILRGNTCSDAAYDCGFADLSHLTRTMRRFWGTTPGAYAMT